MKSINPYNLELIQEYPEDSDELISSKILESSAAQVKNANLKVEERGRSLINCANILLEQKEELAILITTEMGKPFLESVSEIEKCAWVCQYYVENGSRFLANEIIKSDARESYVRFEPLGVILAIMPWNFPFWQVFRAALPAIMAGNSVLLKHASNVTGCALAIESIFAKSGLPENIFTSLIIGSDKIESVIKNPAVKAVTLTGSEAAGASVAALAGKYLKKTVLELGGSDPFIVLSDADLQYAADMAIKSRFINSGQSCIAAKRFIIESEIYEEFTELVVERVNKLKLGNPILKTTEIGPMARVDLADSIIRQIQNSISEGAILKTGGSKASIGEAFVQPTVLGRVKKGMPVFEEEVFGPVLPLIKAESEEEAILIANDSKYGLGASIWTSDFDKARLLAPKIQSGSVFINGIVKSDPRLPFGGIKLSGYGRELSHYGIKAFTNIKTVWAKTLRD